VFCCKGNNSKNSFNRETVLRPRLIVFRWAPAVADVVPLLVNWWTVDRDLLFVMASFFACWNVSISRRKTSFKSETHFIGLKQDFSILGKVKKIRFFDTRSRETFTINMVITLCRPCRIIEGKTKQNQKTW